MSIIHATDATFPQEVIEAPGLVLVDFWAPWCGPCKMISPILDELATSPTFKAKIVKVNVDEESLAPGNLGVRSIPTLILFKDGQVLSKKVGNQTRQALVAWLSEFLQD